MGLASVEIDPKGNARLVFYIDQREFYDRDGNGRIARNIANRLILPRVTPN